MNPEGKFRDIFDPPDKKASVYVLCAKSRSGKSYFAEWLIRSRMKHQDDSLRWKFGMTYCGSAYSGAYNWLPKNSVREGFDEEHLAAYLEKLKEHKRKGKPIPMSFIWLDDLMGVLHQETDLLQNLFTTARHLNINLIICAQTCSRGISTTLRAQTDFALMWDSGTYAQRDALWRAYGGWFEKRKEFVNFLRDRTDANSPHSLGEYSCLAYSDRAKKMEDAYHVVKAPKYAKEKITFG